MGGAFFEKGGGIAMAEGHVCDQYTTHEWEGGGLGSTPPAQF